MSTSFERLSPSIGALVHGVESSSLAEIETMDAIYAGLLDHHVVFIEGSSLGPRELSTLGRGLGAVVNNHHSYVTHPDDRDVVVLEWGGDKRPDAAEWHSDMTYKAEPPFASVLQAVTLPPVGGDTLWASMFSVFDSLPAGLRSELGEMEAVHDMGAFRTPAYRSGGNEAMMAALDDAGSAVHPVVAHHPVTGRPYLNVSESFTRWIIGMSAPESARLLTMLFDAVNRPEHQVRLRWRPGTIAIWDNRGSQHYAIDDYLPHRRVMHRVAVVTDGRLEQRRSELADADVAAG